MKMVIAFSGITCCLENDLVMVQMSQVLQTSVTLTTPRTTVGRRCCTLQPSNLRAWHGSHTHRGEGGRENKFHLTSFCFLSRIPGKCPAPQVDRDGEARMCKGVSLSSTQVAVA